METYFKVLEEPKGKTIPSEQIRKAIDYSLNQKAALYRYLENGHLKPDNNTAGNAIKVKKGIFKYLQ